MGVEDACRGLGRVLDCWGDRCGGSSGYRAAAAHNAAKRVEISVSSGFVAR
jgi:hypothetical protein